MYIAADNKIYYNDTLCGTIIKGNAHELVVLTLQNKQAYYLSIVKK